MKTVYEVTVCENQDINVCLCENTQQDINVCLCENTQTVEVSLASAISQQPRSDYSGPYTVIPMAFSDVELDTNWKTLRDDVVIKEIPYYETSNVSGFTVYIG